MKFDNFQVPPGKTIKLKDYSPASTAHFGSKSEAQQKLIDDIGTLSDLQAKLYAENTYGLLIVLQGIDGSGKDGLIKHVMSGVNPSGCQVKSFKVPSYEELDHDYLWRYTRALPERGNIGIFNRSYYEEVLVVRVHPELLRAQRLPRAIKHAVLWADRYRQINHFERYLVENGIVVLKFFLHLSKEEQKRRFLARLESHDKNWKFSEADVKERAFWDDYMSAYEDMLSHTSTVEAPWHVIPADNKWFTRVAAADIIVNKLTSLGLSYPDMDAAQEIALKNAKTILESEG